MTRTKKVRLFFFQEEKVSSLNHVIRFSDELHTATHCNTLQLTATHYDTLLSNDLVTSWSGLLYGKVSSSLNLIVQKSQLFIKQRHSIQQPSLQSQLVTQSQ